MSGTLAPMAPMAPMAPTAPAAPAPGPDPDGDDPTVVLGYD